MDEWVLHPQAHTALDDILPCVDAATANEFLYQSKEVTSQLVNVVNQVVSNISNSNIPPFLGPPLYYNQSGPLLPLVCNPYNADMTNRTCSTGEIELLNAAKVNSQINNHIQHNSSRVAYEFKCILSVLKLDQNTRCLYVTGMAALYM